MALALGLSACGEHAGRPANCLADIALPRPAPDHSGLVFVKGGTFAEGAKPVNREEGPPHTVSVGSFWIDRTEVTNAQFARFVDATHYVTMAERPLDPKLYPGLTPEQRAPSSAVFVGADGPVDRSDPGQWWRIVPGADWRHPMGPDSSIEGRETMPVVQIAYADALAYAKWLGRDLPTEAEWEYAARGGLKDARYTWGNEKQDPKKPRANTWQGVFPTVDSGEDGYKASAAWVGCFPPNGYGLYDMAGNVWEWTKDWFKPGLDADDDENPEGPPLNLSYDPEEPGTPKHVIKGGSFLCSDDYCYRYRPSARSPGPNDTGASHIGFRTVLRVK